MSANTFYKSAKSFAEKVKKERPGFCSDKGNCLCLLRISTKTMISGFTGIRYCEGKIVNVSAEENAIISMNEAGFKLVKQVIVISLDDFSVIKPSESCLSMLLLIDNSNEKCEVVLSPDTFDTVKNLENPPIIDNISDSRELDTSSNPAMVNGPQEDEPLINIASVKPSESEPAIEESKGAPSTVTIPDGYASTFELDPNNPFMAEPDNEAVSEVITLQPHTDSLEASEPTTNSSVLSSNTQEESAENIIERNSTFLSKEDMKKQVKEMKKAAKRNNKLMKKLF